jgi:hypothetical protein
MGEKKKSSKAGKHKRTCDRYRTSGHRIQNKIVRIARSNGYDEAMEYASIHIHTSWAKKRLANFTFGRTPKE